MFRGTTRLTDSVLARIAPLVLCLLAGCVPAHGGKARLALPCPVPGASDASAGGANVFVARTNRSECRDGAWVLSRERGDGPAFDRASRGDKHWAFAPGNEAGWFAALKSQALGASHGRPPRVLLYIHGFNNGPDQALDRAHRIAQDADFKGPVVALIWPSQRGVFKYAVDEASNEWTSLYAYELLVKLAAAKLDIVLVSHSMGNRITSEALERLHAQSPDLVGRIRSVVLASPDIDAGLFDRDMARAFTAPERTVTIYASGRDTALAASSRLHGFRRLGDLGCKFAPAAERATATATANATSAGPCYPHLDEASGVRVIDTSAVSQSPFGHSDFIASPAGRADLCRVINNLAEQGRRAIPGYAGVFALGPSAASRADCPDTAPPQPAKRKKAHHAAP